MKQPTELHPALSAQTTDDYDTNGPNVRPLVPIVTHYCANCEVTARENERLLAQIEALRETVKQADLYIGEWKARDKMLILNEYHRARIKARAIGALRES